VWGEGRNGWMRREESKKGAEVGGGEEAGRIWKGRREGKVGG